ncbi:ABC transporter ATP-binding protein [Glaciihabitans sp. GrIS 2.15]|uniref:ABC transporter ATP-binding protein n=1 Tax=Glaciihabitans sp. GrIS 2.15 TaxID=3071710 RepID=UPI002E02250A|nr:iron(III) transport system ATP-binding protein [Glaciihabitans sp. GrIS 2.15]
MSEIEPSTSEHSTIDLRGIGKRYGSTPVLESIDLSVPAGSKTVIVGSSGSGKTTLLRLLSGFDFPDVGTIRIGREIVAGPGVAVPAHRRGVGHVAQDGALFPHLTVGQNVAFGLDRHERDDRPAIVSELLDLVSLDPVLASRRPDELSGGQQQRVALARAMARKPSVMLLDEPFSSLDTGLRASTRELVSAALTSAGITTVLVTHDRAEALTFGDQVAVLRDGRLAQVGTPTALYCSPTDLATARFLGDVVLLEANASAGQVRCPLGVVARCTSLNGGCTALFRPEQLVIDLLVPGVDAGGIVARIAAAEFQGSSQLLTLEIAGTSGLELPVASGIQYRVGDQVTIHTIGDAIVFPAS